MKDEEIFINTNFGSVNLTEFKHKMEQSGWIIVTVDVNGSTQVTIYENADDKEWDEPTTFAHADSFDKAFLTCLIDIQNYYIRVK